MNNVTNCLYFIQSNIFKIFTEFCKTLQIVSSRRHESIRFPNVFEYHNQQRSYLDHQFEYQFMYDNKPAYKHSDGQDIYLYWSSDNNGEWMVEFFI